MRKLVAIVVVVLVTAVAAPAAARGAPRPDVRRLVVVAVPGLTWRDVQREQPPALVELGRRGAVASLSLRTVGRTTSAAEAFLTMGAGTRSLVPAGDPQLVVPPDQPVPGGRAGDVANRRVGAVVDDGVAVVPRLPELRRVNARSRYGGRPGLLAERLARAGRTIAAVGGEAGLMAMDRFGRVAAGTTGDRLLVPDTAAPDGLRTDPAAVAAALSAVTADVVVVELGDVARATTFGTAALPEAAAAVRAAAVRGVDDAIGRIVGALDLARDVVLVVAPTSPVLRGSDQLTVALAAGAGIEPGLLRSGTTRRPGYVTLPDVAPTILRSLGLAVPTSMSGAPMASDGSGSPGAATVRDLIVDNKQALFRNRATGPLTVTLIVVQVLSYAAAALALARGHRRWHRVLTTLSLLTTAVPLVAFTSGLLPYRALGVPGYVAAVFGVAGLLAALALGAAEVAARRGVRRAHLVAPLVIAGLTVVTLLADVLAGAPLQIATPFGYGGGPLVAGRFSGYGNLTTGLLAQSLLVAVTAWWGLRTPGRGDRGLLVAMTALFAGAVVAIGAPQLGQDVGGVLSVLPAFVFIVLLAAGISLTWRRVAVTAVGTLGTLGAFGVVDLARPAEQRTHLGRFFALLADRGPGAFVDVLDRKLHSNLHALTTSVWVLLVAASVVYVLHLRRRPALGRLEASLPGLRLFLVGTAALALLGTLLNDSGIAIPGLMSVLAVPYLTFLVLQQEATTTALTATIGDASRAPSPHSVSSPGVR